MVHWRRALGYRRHGKDHLLVKSHIFPFLKLPLELRIRIYEYYLANGIHINRRRRLPSLLRTNIRITHEIYKFCTITAIYEIKFPNVYWSRVSNVYWPRWFVSQLHPWQRARYLFCKCISRFHTPAHRQFKRILRSIEKFAAYEDREKLVAKVKTRCVRCVYLEEWKRGIEGCQTCRGILRYEVGRGLIEEKWFLD